METYTDTAPTMRAQTHNHAPIIAGFTRKNSAKARSIGYHEEQAPTIATDDKATVFVSGGYAAFDEKQVAGSVRASGGDRGGAARTS